jgi:hypothetical protein
VNERRLTWADEHVIVIVVVDQRSRSPSDLRGLAA